MVLLLTSKGRESGPICSPFKDAGGAEAEKDSEVEKSQLCALRGGNCLLAPVGMSEELIGWVKLQLHAVMLLFHTLVLGCEDGVDTMPLFTLHMNRQKNCV